MNDFTLRRPGRALAALVAVLALLAAGCGGSGSTDGGGSGSGSTSGSGSGGDSEKTLRFAYFAGERTSFGQLWSWWMDEVEARTDGRIRFERFWDASLLKGPEMADGLRDGRVDVAQIVPPMYPGKFPLTSVTELPFVSENVPAGAQAIAEILRENRDFQAEWQQQGLVPLAWNIASPGALGTKEPIRSADDLDGKKLRGIDRSSKVLGAAGANLVNLDVNEIYGGMERGLINGFFGIPFAFVGPLKFPEVAKNYTDVGMGITTANAIAMSEQGWESLSPEVQRVMAEVSAEVPAKLAEYDGIAEDATCEAIRAEDATLSKLPEAETEKLRAAGEEQVREEWLDEVSGSVDGQSVYDTWVETTRTAEGDFPDYRIGIERCMSGGDGT